MPRVARFARYSQPRLPKGERRESLPACVAGPIYAEADKIARREKVSRSWVVATILARAFAIDIVPYSEAGRLAEARRRQKGQ